MASGFRRVTEGAALATRSDELIGRRETVAARGGCHARSILVHRRIDGALVRCANVNGLHEFLTGSECAAGLMTSLVENPAFAGVVPRESSVHG